MKKFTALALVAGLSATGAHAQYDLIYDANTGDVSMALGGGNMINYVLENNGGTSFIVANHDGFVNDIYVGGNPVASTGNPTATENFLGESFANQNFANGGFDTSAPISIGQVLPAGLSEGDFQAAFDKQATYVADLGTAVTPFDLVYIPVPEPTSLALLGLGGLLVARRRR